MKKTIVFLQIPHQRLYTFVDHVSNLLFNRSKLENFLIIFFMENFFIYLCRKGKLSQVFNKYFILAKKLLS